MEFSQYRSLFIVDNEDNQWSIITFIIMKYRIFCVSA